MNQKIQQLQDVIAKNSLAHVMAAHSPLSARLAEETGNRAVRAATMAMQKVFRQIRQDRGIDNAHNEIVSV